MLHDAHASYRPAGIRFEPVATPQKETLPRMDVVVFVGFASQGRLHEPWPVESTQGFTREFGEELPLAWDRERGEEIRGYLAPAVRSFFGNGGRRCWIIRVDDPVDLDGSARFSANLFLDHDLKNLSSEQLLSQADFLRYQSPTPRKLKGIHAALEIEEATIIAVPDAVHLGWKFMRNNEPAVPDKSRPQYRPAYGNFSDCLPGELAVPVFLSKSPPDDQAGSFTLSWSKVPGATYILEEATRPDWSGAVVIYEGDKLEFTLRDYPQGDYFYRVCAEVAGKRSNWSLGTSVQVLESKRWQQNPIKRYSSRSLLMIHRSLLCLCAARGDMSAVLSMPVHFRENAALRHVRKLRSTEGLAVNDLSFVSLYHPWLISRDDSERNRISTLPPDGTICGMMAQRALARGAWVAPANEALKDVIALAPPLSHKSRIPLQESRINLIRLEPNGFMVLSADTLCDDKEFRPVNVRRLLILIRKLALKKGSEYVFEPNDAVFRRMVQRGFESMLDEMFMRGAFSGATPALAYQVNTGSSLNTPQSVDQGRFIVELKVSPSRPMKFLTIRLMQTGDRMSIAEGA